MHARRDRKRLRCCAAQKLLQVYIARLAYEPGLFDAIKKSHDEYREKQRQAGENNFEGEE